MLTRRRPHLQLEPLVLAPGPACVNCGAGQLAAYCAECGQPTVRERVTMGGLARRVATDVFDVDRGLLHTAISLFRRPGEAARDYVRGRTVPYASPLKFFVISVTLAQLAIVFSGQDAEMAAGFDHGMTVDGTAASPATVTQRETMTVLGQYLALLVAPSVAVLAAAQRLVYRRSGHNYAEHLIFALYAESRAFLSYAAVVVALETLSKLGVPGMNAWVGGSAVVGWAVAMFAYYVAATRDCFGLGRASAIVRSALVGALTIVGCLAILGVTLASIDGSRRSADRAGRRATAAPAAPASPSGRAP